MNRCTIDDAMAFSVCVCSFAQVVVISVLLLAWISIYAVVSPESMHNK
jgi:hypothetical protein